MKRPHPERVADYLDHIAEAIARAIEYIRPLSGIGAFEQSQQVQDAVVRNIEIIGEAVNHINRVAPGFIGRHPELPWAEMRAMRNVVIHQYFSVDLKILWTTVVNDLPGLQRQIDRLLSEERGGRT